jgi:hypothetical protein
MKNGVIFDFCFCLILGALLSGGLFIGRLVLYGGEQSKSGKAELFAAVEPELCGRLQAGDLVFDALTKRAVGKILSVEEQMSDDALIYRIELDMKSALIPTHPLRTKRLWFEYTVTERQGESNEASL